jgi:hypothetical protein
MERFRAFLMLFLALGLAACASGPPMVRSSVTSFHQWPAALEQRSFTMQPLTGAADTLEMKSYQRLMAAQLTRLGMVEKADGFLKVGFTAVVLERDANFSEPYVLDPMFYRPWRFGIWQDPYTWPVYERVKMVARFTRTLKVEITSAKGEKLFEATAISEGGIHGLSRVMPAMVSAVFEDFPGANGKTRIVDGPLEPADGKP